MEIIWLIVIFCLGTEWGSFLTLIGHRLPKGENFLNGKSYCDSCKHELIIWDKIPIISYIMLGGKCRYCKKSISSISTYMEFFTGILFALSLYIFGISCDFFIAIGIVLFLIVITTTDIFYYIIPDSILVFFTIYFFIFIFIKNGFFNAFLSLGYGFITFIFMILVMYVGNKIFKKDTLGGGDIKLMFLIGMVLGPLSGILSIFVASFLALPIAIVALACKKENIIPFGPFLLVAFLFIYFIGFDTNTLLNYIQSII